ncbi:MAG: phosphate acyltransferase PlsX, partial [Candidatus Brocadiia bacterium]|nr:phosphate acyltransferase PlsX [Candidatus Brocadiia bacterium]
MDALGGDRAPEEPVAGAVMAARNFPDTQILLAGPPEVINAQLGKLAPRPGNIVIVPASERIGMDESPVQALREKRDSSITVGMTRVVEGEADAFVSAGNTGAVVAASSLGLGLIAGVQRPGIVVPMRLIDRPLIVIDVGANIHCKSMHLLQYGIMATVFAREIFHLANPRVGLLNVGEEAGKGTMLVKKAFQLLSAAELNFVGNVEAKDALSGGCDIVVCDGFAGNVLLKTCE